MLHGLIFGINEASAAVLECQNTGGALREFSRCQESIVRDLLIRCQDYQDVLFHDTLYNWLFQPLENNPNVSKNIYMNSWNQHMWKNGYCVKEEIAVTMGLGVGSIMSITLTTLL